MVRDGHDPEELARKVEPSAQSIRNWVTQAGGDDSRRQDGLASLGRGRANMVQIASIGVGR